MCVDRIRPARLAEDANRHVFGQTWEMDFLSGAIRTKSNPLMNCVRICNCFRNVAPPPPGVGSEILAVPSSWSVVKE